MKRSLTLTIASWLLLAPSALANIPNIPGDEPQPTERPSDGDRAEDVRFSCERVNGRDTVMYYPESQPGETYAWVTPSSMGSNWSSDRRCREIARRLESYRPDGLLELANGFENGYDTVCVTTELDSSCRIVLTVPPGQDPQITRDRTFQNIVVADSGTQTQPVSALTGNGSWGGGGGVGDFGLGDLSLDPADGDDLAIVGDILGGSQAGSTLRITDSSDRIDLRPFLDPADGGSGAMLSPGRSLSIDGGARPSSGSNRLNPDGFR
ncbi:MAG: COP23 domain-containing protein [Geitlerinemataceae cyanobacterium]